MMPWALYNTCITHICWIPMNKLIYTIWNTSDIQTFTQAAILEQIHLLTGIHTFTQWGDKDFNSNLLHTPAGIQTHVTGHCLSWMFGLYSCNLTWSVLVWSACSDGIPDLLLLPWSRPQRSSCDPADQLHGTADPPVTDPHHWWSVYAPEIGNNSGYSGTESEEIEILSIFMNGTKPQTPKYYNLLFETLRLFWMVVKTIISKSLNMIQYKLCIIPQTMYTDCIT